MSKFFQFSKSAMAVIGCLFCILIAVTKLLDPMFHRRCIKKEVLELCDMQEMCARVECARQATKNGGDMAWEHFLSTNSYYVVGRSSSDGQFYFTAMITNPDAKVWDRGSRDDNRVRAYFFLWEKDGIQVWKECVGKKYPLKKISSRLWTTDMRRKLFEVFEEVYGEKWADTHSPFQR